jgi:hypothetical protein
LEYSVLKLKEKLMISDSLEIMTQLIN